MKYQNYQNLMLLTSSDTKRTLMHLFLFTNSAQRELFQYVRRVYTTAIALHSCLYVFIYLGFTVENLILIRVKHTKSFKIYSNCKAKKR